MTKKQVFVCCLEASVGVDFALILIKTTIRGYPHLIVMIGILFLLKGLSLLFKMSYSLSSKAAH